MTIDLRKPSEDLFAVLMDETESEAYCRVKSVEPGEGIETFIKIFKCFMGIGGVGLQDKARQIMAQLLLNLTVKSPTRWINCSTASE